MKKRRATGEAPPAPPPAGQGDLFGAALLPLTPPKEEAVAPKPPESAVRPPVPEPPARPPAPVPPAALADVSTSLSPLPGAPARPAAPTRTVLTVGELTQQLKATIESRFPRVLVRGEVSGFRGANPRGHLYFTLKDAEASIDVKMWASQAAR